MRCRLDQFEGAPRFGRTGSFSSRCDACLRANERAVWNACENVYIKRGPMVGGKERRPIAFCLFEARHLHQTPAELRPRAPRSQISTANAGSRKGGLEELTAAPARKYRLFPVSAAGSPSSKYES